MKRFTDSETARQYVLEARSKGKSVGIVPTMGALHDGHLSLIRLSNKRCDVTVATIFVNPTQFAPNEDLDKYPRTLQADCAGLSSEGADAVFIPSMLEMYPSDFSTYVNPPKIAERLEGHFRPEHFRGVATVVMKLFQILPATHAIFGRKDYQQLKVIEAMTRDLNVGITIVRGDIVRETDGLALSSRNRYLSDDQRRRALQLSAALNRVTEMAKQGETSADTLKQTMTDILLTPDAGVDQVDYATLVDERTLLPIETLTSPAMALIAAHVGQTRLIDNALILPPV